MSGPGDKSPAAAPAVAPAVAGQGHAGDDPASGVGTLLVVVEPPSEGSPPLGAALIAEGIRLARGLGADPRIVTWSADPAVGLDSLATALADLAREAGPVAVLLADTDIGRQLAPMVAHRMGSGSVVGCSDVLVCGAGLSFVKPAYGGWLEREIDPATGTAPVATLDLTGVGEPELPPEGPQIPEVLEVGPPVGPAGIRRLDLTPPDPRSVDLVHARRIVAAGSGGANERLLAAARELADLLGGSLGATRPVVDDGRLPKERLIGQTGRTVSPELYLALGISGSPHHVAGVQGADRILSINRDLRAPIFQFSDVGYVADLEAVLPALVQKIKEWRMLSESNSGASMSTGDFDAIVVGAGPAGTSAALGLARKGAKVLLLERGEYPGAKNMFGGMMAYCTAPEQLVPGFWEHAPWERAVTKRVLTVVGEGSSTSLAFQAASASDRPSAGAGSTSDRTLTGFTLFRPTFDRWYAEQAVAQGVTLLTDCLVEGLVMRDGAVRGVRMAGSGDTVEAPLVVACDGTLSLLAREGGLHEGVKLEQVALGVRALYQLTEEDINARFGLSGRGGATHEFLGCTEGIRGGGFVYTQAETLSVGMVMHLDSLKERMIPPYELLEDFVASVPMASLLRGARLVEYSAHLLPEAGRRMVPRLSTAGLLVAGDAAGLCYTNGLIQEGMNLAMTSGLLAAQTGARALAEGDFSVRSLAGYARELEDSFVLRDMKTFGRAIDFMHEDRLFAAYPRVVGKLMEDLYRSDGSPKQKAGRLGRRALKDELSMRELVADLFRGEGATCDSRRTVRSGELPRPS